MIEEMVLWLEMHENPKYEPIIAVIKAAQTMRSEMDQLTPTTLYGTVPSRTPGMEAYDAATRPSLGVGGEYDASLGVTEEEHYASLEEDAATGGGE